MSTLPLRPGLEGETPYGAPELDVPVRLNVNENPYAPSEAVVASIRDAVAEAATGLNRYPDRDFPALRGALACFLELGYHGSTMRGVAERAGLSVAGLYHYSSSKQQLLVSLLDRTMDDLTRRTSAAQAEAEDPWTRFARLVEPDARL